MSQCVDDDDGDEKSYESVCLYKNFRSDNVIDEN